MVSLLCLFLVHALLSHLLFVMVGLSVAPSVCLKSHKVLLHVFRICYASCVPFLSAYSFALTFEAKKKTPQQSKAMPVL